MQVSDWLSAGTLEEQVDALLLQTHATLADRSNDQDWFITGCRHGILKPAGGIYSSLAGSIIGARSAAGGS